MTPNARRKEDEHHARVYRFPDGEPLTPLRRADRPRRSWWLYALIALGAVVVWALELFY